MKKAEISIILCILVLVGLFATIPTLQWIDNHYKPKEHIEIQGITTIASWPHEQEQPIGEYCQISNAWHYNDGRPYYYWTPFTASQVVDEYNGAKKIANNSITQHDGMTTMSFNFQWIDAKYIFLYKDYIGEMRMRDRDAMERKLKGEMK